MVTQNSIRTADARMVAPDIQTNQLARLGLGVSILEETSMNQLDVWKTGTRLLGCVTIVLPAFNAGQIIANTIFIISEILEDTGIPGYEIIVVDDGSIDDTSKYASRATIGARGELRIIRHQRNRGKGVAIATGALHASCPYTAFLDADGDIHPRQLLYILAPLHVYDVVVTSKWHPESNIDASLLRRILSHGYRLLTWLTTGLRLRDTQTGAKAFRTYILRKALKHVYTRRYSFDAELLAVLSRLGARIVEVPSIAPLSLYGRQKPSTIVQMLLELLAIAYRLRSWTP